MKRAKLKSIKSTEHRRGLMAGIALAFASINRAHDVPTVCADTMKLLGITYEDFKEAGVDSYDLRELRKILKA